MDSSKINSQSSLLSNEIDWFHEAMVVPTNSNSNVFIICQFEWNQGASKNQSLYGICEESMFKATI
jgi:hypothetical protein